jgi:hypothetical protein
MRRMSLVWMQVVALGMSAGCGGCEDERTFTGTYFAPYEYGTYEVTREPRLSAPDRLSFGALGAREFAKRELEIANVGRAPLTLESMQIDPMFTLKWPGFMDGQQPRVLAPGERVVTELFFVSPDGGQYEGELVIKSDDPQRPEHRVALTVNKSVPCLTLEPADRVNFGTVQPGQTRERTVVFKSCSDTEVTTILESRIRGGGRNFMPSPVAMTLAPGQSQQMRITFQPFAPQSYQATLVVQSDDPERPVQEVELVGSGAPFPCPRAQIDAQILQRMVSAQAAPVATLRGRPLDRVKLSGVKSLSPDGAAIIQYEWSLVRKPADSTAQVERGLDGEASLFLDLTGDYVVEMMAIDERGVPACEPARLTIEAVPHEDVHVQLVWDTPGDRDQLDQVGTDVDLHLKHEVGSWNDGRWDCFWQNLRPEWGAPGPDDDPSLDIDDVDGSGPENINMTGMESGRTYSVGVHYFAAQGFGRSFATVRLYVRGELVQELRRKPLDDQEFWHVLDIRWPSREIVVRDAVFPTIP